MADDVPRETQPPPQPRRKRIDRRGEEGVQYRLTEADHLRALGQDGYRTFSAPVVTNSFSRLRGSYAERMRQKIF